MKIKPFHPGNGPGTFVSVVVACRNEKQNLPILLKSISMQDYPGELFEVIIVDDNSSDNTFEIASGFTGSSNVIAIYNKGIGKKQAVRTGVNASSGSLIITTDADCRMGKRWISTIASFHETLRSDMIICPVQIESRPGFFGRFQELEFLSLQGITAGSVLSGDGTMCNGANLAFTREAYLKHSGNVHDEIASGDDVFLLHSLKKDNLSEISWLESPETVVTAASSPTIGSFLKQRRRWISKSKAYDDWFTIFLGIVTFVTILVSISLLIAVIINPEFLWVFLTFLLLKSIPDFLILHNTSVRYGKTELMHWFLPAQIVYPFYVLIVAVYSVIPLKRPEY
ncbi:MAG: glycosyltransferase [Bacteroidales bacterium]|nr:glycosyltransferase [Bacteroidales bacterium]